MATDNELCFMTAWELAHVIRSGQVSAREVTAAHLEQIERVNPQVNAVVTLVADQGLAAAGAADETQAHGELLGPLHGLPVLHKDLTLTKGIRTTFGSPIYRDFVPEVDALIVERLHAAGAITLGKTNTPEFAAGSQTFNAVFGATRNPYDLSKTCGGSSGGAAVALACGMAPLADGSDMGGSLRNPAGYCNVVGLRPAAGRVPLWPATAAWSPLSVLGPMARTVGDVALMLGAIAGPDRRAPLAIAEDGARFLRPLERDFHGVRVAWSPDLGGLPVDPVVSRVLDVQRPVFEALGCRVEETEPDLDGADEAFKILRAWLFELEYGELLEQHPGAMKESVVWNIQEGRRVTGPQLGRAERLRTQLYERARLFMERYEFLLLPVSQAPPFDVEQPYVTEINGVAMETYIDWMKSCYLISVLGLPAISVPCGFSGDGLPVGLQIVGRHQDEWGVLQLAHAFEQATGFWKRRPGLAN